MIKEFTKRALRRRGIIVRRVRYQVAVPEKPFPVQKWLINQLGIESPVIFDVGGNIGQSIRRYLGLFPRAHVFSFEPFADSFAELQRRFGTQTNVRLFSHAITDVTGTVDFHVTKMPTTHSLLPRPKQGRRYYPRIAEDTGAVIKVSAITLDEFAAQQEIDRIDILKMDIQGGEIRALQGAKSLLQKQRVRLIYLESAFIRHYQDEALFHEIAGLMSEYSYSLFDLYNLFRATNGQLRYCDALFVNDELRMEVLNRFPDEP